ncbi:hypothetical protein SBC1_24940 [Caballeronia sp. SBC1]|uniref:hypothetical protein n=1 Tax=Caballeronia sp. SBC1 TaxID=2705548 RepID=UPI0014072D95|nr:hypothetical protein [Caballeronia sp. SBC1]QIN62479.1 hypothetical protein SBC1_24940 [Caballeronia sp. SBC1]
MNHNDRARLLRHRQRVTLQEAAYLIIERLGGGWADAVSLLAEAAELKRLPADVKPLLATWTNTAIAPVDPEKSTVLTADLLAWLDTVGALPLRNEQDLGARVEAGYLLGDAYPNDGPAITLGADSGAKTGKLDAAEKHKNRHLAVIECANGAMFSVAELDSWAVSNKLHLSFESLLAKPDRTGDYTTDHHYVSYEILSDAMAWNVVPEGTSPDDARLQLKAAHDIAEPSNPVSRLRDLVMVRYDRQLLCAVYDGDLNLYDTLTYTKLDVTANRLRYDAQPESYLPAANQPSGTTAGASPLPQTTLPNSMDAISLAEALNFIARDVEVPKGRTTVEDEPMWRASEAAKMLYERLHNALGNSPRWAEIHATIGRPLFNDTVAVEGMAILMHAAEWYGRETTNHYEHTMACVRTDLDPAVVGPAPRDPNGGQWDYGKHFMREHQIGFARAELSNFLDVPLGAVTHGDREEARKIIEQRYARLDHVAWAMVILTPDAPPQGEGRSRQILGVTRWLESLGLQCRTYNGLPASQPKGVPVVGIDVREYQYLAVADVRAVAIADKCWPALAATNWTTPDMPAPDFDEHWTIAEAAKIIGTDEAGIYERFLDGRLKASVFFAKNAPAQLVKTSNPLWLTDNGDVKASVANELRRVRYVWDLTLYDDKKLYNANLYVVRCRYFALKHGTTVDTPEVTFGIFVQRGDEIYRLMQLQPVDGAVPHAQDLPDGAVLVVRKNELVSSGATDEANAVGADNPHEPDWGVWRHALKLTLRDAVCLSCNTAPGAVPHDVGAFFVAELLPQFAASKDVRGEISRRLGIAKSHAGTGGTLSTVTGGNDGEVYLARFAEWALNTMRWTVPDEMRALASIAQQTPAALVPLAEIVAELAELRWSNHGEEESAAAALEKAGGAPGYLSTMYAVQRVEHTYLWRIVGRLASEGTLKLFDPVRFVPTDAIDGAVIDGDELLSLLNDVPRFPDTASQEALAEETFQGVLTVLAEAEHEKVRAHHDGSEPIALLDWLGHDTWKAEEALPILFGLSPDDLVRYTDKEGAARLVSARHLDGSLVSFDAWQGWNDFQDMQKRRAECPSLEEHYYPVGAVMLHRVSKELTKAERVWSSGDHPPRSAPAYYVEWAQRKGFVVPWLQWARDKGLPVESPMQPDSGAEKAPETPEQRRQRVMAVLKKHGGNKAAAGRELGISAERVRQLVAPKKGAPKDIFASHDPFNIRLGKPPRRS